MALPSILGKTSALQSTTAAGGAERGVLHHIGDIDAEVRTVAEVVANRRAQVLQCHHDVRDAVLTQQSKDVLHDGLAHHRNERLRHTAGQRTKPRAFTAGHHYCFHNECLKRSPGTDAPLASAGGPASCAASFRIRSLKNAADSSGLTTLIQIPVPSSNPAAVLSLGMSSRCQ